MAKKKHYYYTPKRDHIVTKGKWSYSCVSGTGIPRGYCEISPFYFEGDKLIKAKDYGKLIKYEDFNKYGLAHGYLRIMKKGKRYKIG